MSSRGARGKRTQADAAPRTTEIVSLADRVGYIQALRGALAATTVTVAIAGSLLVGASAADLLLITALYVFVAATGEAIRRSLRGRGLALLAGMILVDAVYVAWAMYATGGMQSPLRFLAYLHVIAVSLLASYRTGLKIALWHSLLFFVVFYAQAAGILSPVDSGAEQLVGSGPEFYRLSAINIFGLWSVAIATAVFSSLNERELRRRKGDLENLSRLATELQGLDDTNAIAATILTRLCDDFGFKRGLVLGGGREELALLAYRAPNEAPETKAAVDPLIEAAWRDGAPKLVKQIDATTDPRLASLLPLGRNLVIAPLTAEGQPQGAIVVEHPSSRGGRIERRIVAMVEQYALLGALAVRNARLLDVLHRVAATDALTGIANRRTFEKALNRELSRATRHGEQVTLVILDIDHFKALNDTHGHQSGDEVLRQVALALNSRSRDFDTTARYGGEEFAVILPSCSVKESLVVAERIRTAVADIDSPVKVTASAGVATFPTHASDAVGLVKSADEALYESKRLGRDRLTRSRRRATTKPVVSARDTD